MELNYLLEGLEGIVRKIIAPDSLLKEEFESSLQKFQAEVSAIQQVLGRELFKSGNEKHLERYIQYHQQAIIKLADLLPLASQNNTPTDHEGVVDFQPFVVALESLLTFIEKHFKPYFDQDMNIPMAYRLILKNEGLTRLDVIEQNLNRVEDELKKLLLRPLQKMLRDDPPEAITFRSVIYNKELMRELVRSVQHAEDDQFERELWKACLYLNYNSIHTFNFYTRKVGTELKSLDTLSQQIEHLLLEAKGINQAQVRPGIAFHTTAPSLRTQLVEWLNEEIYFLERKQQLMQQGGKKLPVVSRDAKFKIDLSVAQLACLLRLLVESEIIVNRNVSELIRQLVRAVQTKRSESISDESLRLKYYNVEDGTKSSVHAVLLKLTKTLMKSP